MAKFIHNKSGVVKSYLGTEIQDGEFYQIPVEKEIAYSQKDNLISDISSGVVCMSKDGSTDITIGISYQIDFLKSNIPQDVSIAENKPFADAKGFRARFKGISGIATAGQTTNIDYTLSEERYITGVRLLVKDCAFGDNVDLEIVDTTYTYAGILYSADDNGTAWSVSQPNGVVLDRFGESWYVANDGETQPDVVVPYPARLLAGLTVRIIYHSVGLINSDLKANIYLHWKSE